MKNIPLTALSLLLLSHGLLLAQPTAELVTAGGHQYRVMRAVFSLDSKWIATGSEDRTVKIWETSTRRLIRTLAGHTDDVTRLAFSANGKSLITGSNDNTVKVWDVTTGNILHTLNGHSDRIRHVAYSKDASMIITASDDKTAILWDAVTGQVIHTFVHPEKVNYAAISPDKKWVLTKAEDRTLRIFKIDTWELWKSASTRYDFGIDADFSPDGKSVACVADSLVEITELSTRNVMQTLRGSKVASYFVRYSPDGKALLTIAGKNTRLWETATGKLMNTVKTSRVMEVDFSADSRTLVLSEYDGCTVIGVPSGAIIRQIEGHFGIYGSAAASWDGNLLLTYDGYKSNARVYDVKSGKILFRLDGLSERVKTVRFLTDETAVLSTDSACRVWDKNSGRLLKVVYGKNPVYSSTGKWVAVGDSIPELINTKTGSIDFRMPDSRSVKRIKFSPDDAWAITFSSDSVGRLWNLEKKASVGLLKLKKSFGYPDVYFPSNGKNVVLVTYYIGSSNATWWDLAEGKKIRSVDGTIQASPDEKKLLVYNAPSGGHLLDLSTGEVLQEMGTPTYRFAGNRHYTHAQTINDFVLVEPETGRPVKTFALTENISCVDLSADGKKLVVAAGQWMTVFDVASGKVVKGWEGHAQKILAVRFSMDSKLIVSSSEDKMVKIWDASTGALRKALRVTGQKPLDIQFSRDGSKVSIISEYDWVSEWWDWSKEQRLLFFNHKTDSDLGSVPNFNTDGRWLVTLVNLYKVGIFDAASRKLVREISEPRLGNYFNVVKLSEDGTLILTTSQDGRVRLWNTSTGERMHTLETGLGKTGKAKFSSDGKWVIAGEGSTTTLWNCKTGAKSTVPYTAAVSSDAHMALKWDVSSKVSVWESNPLKLVCTLEKTPRTVYNFQISEDGKYVIHSFDSTQIWDMTTGRKIQVPKTDAFVSSSFLVPNRPWFAEACRDLTFRIRDYNGKQIYSFPTSSLVSTDRYRFSSDKKSLTIVDEFGAITIWDLETGNKTISWIGVGNSDWVVNHSTGLFDASAGAMDKLYFVQGMDVVDFGQLKDRFLEPGLWNKALRGEKLRNVSGFKSIDLPPDILVGSVDDKGFLPIQLTNRGSGIGEVSVFINGKEIIKDARENKTKPDVPSVSLKVFVGRNPNLVKGIDNLIGVKAWNGEHWVVSKSKIVAYMPKGAEEYKPAVHILTCGISDYTGTEIDLKYASKDAGDMNLALQLGAKKLFGAERSYVYNLTTLGAKENYPTKANILKAFDQITAKAHPLDIFVMYISGHGMNGNSEDGEWYYLTQEAYSSSASAYHDPAIRAQTTLSNGELVELFKKVPALKQVLVIDACASGKVVDNLMAKKDIESGTLRALDRMRDRTGMHIITGCTADAVSYEASKYGQGVLTYSLLEGIRGAALRDEQYIDIVKLFAYAQERVPRLAEGIGGIQSPQVFSPQGSQSFDIGLLTDVEKKAIPIAKIRPVYIRSNFQDEKEMEDAVELGKAVDEALNDFSAKGTEAKIIFVDVRNYPEGCRLSGRYTTVNGKIVLKLRKKCGEEDKTYDLEGGSVEEVRERILKLL